MKQTILEKEEVARTFFKDSEYFIFHGIRAVNHTPHIYEVPQKTLDFIEEHQWQINDDTMEKLEAEGFTCGVEDCKLPYSEHTYDIVCFLEAKKNMANHTAAKVLAEFKDFAGEGFIDGLSFVESEEGYRIMEPIKDN